MISKEELTDFYHVQKLSFRDIGAKFGKTETFAKYWFKKYNLKPRSKSESCKLRCESKPQTNPGRKGMPKNPNYGKENHAWKGGSIRKDG